MAEEFRVSIGAQLNSEEFESIKNQINNIQTKPINLKIDAKGVQSQIDSIKRQIQSLSNVKINLIGTGSNNASGVQKTVNDIGKAYDSLSQRVSNIKSNLSNEIQLRLESGDFETRLNSVDTKMSKLTSTSDILRSNIQTLHTAFDTMSSSDVSIDDKIKAYEEFNNLLPTVRLQLTAATQAQRDFEQSAKDAATAQQILTKSSTLSNDIQTWMNQNTKATEKFGDKLREIQSQLKGNEDPALLRKLSYEFANIKSEAKSAGLVTNTFAQELKNVALQVTGLGSAAMVFRKVFNEIKEGVNTVVELDTALVDLQKTSDASASQLTQYYYEANDAAKELGVTTKEIIQSAADWSRLGFSLDEAKIMSRVSSIFKSISPDLDIDSATDGLISAMKAFDIEAENALDGIASKINVIGNTQGVSNGDLVDIITRASAAMSEANNTLEDTIALGTAATEITRDASSVGTALRTISMRIRGYDEDTEEYIGGVEELSGAIADLTKTASSPGGISLFTDASKTEYKSTIDLLRDISEVYDELTDKEQAALLEKLGGKRGGQVVAAIISNFDTVEKSLNSMSDSAGNAEAEMEIITNSLEYKLNALKETGVGIWQNLFQREDIGVAIDLLTNLLEVIDKITEYLGLFGTVAVGGGLFAFIKNLD